MLTSLVMIDGNTPDKLAEIIRATWPQLYSKPMTRKLDPEDRILDDLFKKEIKKRNDKKLDDKFNYDTGSK